jgi:hypothetical protein
MLYVRGKWVRVRRYGEWRYYVEGGMLKWWTMSQNIAGVIRDASL